MPELPEVETIRLGLQKYLVGHVVERIEVRLSKIVSGDTQRIQGAKVQRIRRFGKGLVIDFTNDYSLAIHIKMTGQLIYKKTKGKMKAGASGGSVGTILPNLYTHVIFKLKAKNAKRKTKESSYLYYNDIRQFGWIKIVKTDEVSSLPFFKTLGPEPLSNLTIQRFSNIVKKAKSPIKPLLMNQKKIAGIGNIYANDALFRAGIHPQRVASDLSEEEVQKLFAAIEFVLKKGITAGGASETNYVNALGGKGSYQNYFLVYGKGNTPCIVCGSRIIRTTIAGRGTFFCETCQV